MPGKMDVPLQHHRKAVIIISRNSHGSQHSCFWEVPWETQGLKSFLFCGGSCSSLLLPSHRFLSFRGKKSEIVSPSFFLSWEFCSWTLARVSVHQYRFWAFSFLKKSLTYSYQGYQEFCSELHMSFPAQNRCEAGVLPNRCTHQSSFQRLLIHPCRSLQFVSNSNKNWGEKGGWAVVLWQ